MFFAINVISIFSELEIVLVLGSKRRLIMKSLSRSIPALILLILIICFSSGLLRAQGGKNLIECDTATYITETIVIDEDTLCVRSAYCGDKLLSRDTGSCLDLNIHSISDVVTVHRVLDPDEYNRQIRKIDSLTITLHEANKKIISKKKELAKLRYKGAASEEIYKAEKKLIELENAAIQRQYEIDKLLQYVLKKFWEPRKVR